MPPIRGMYLRWQSVYVGQLVAQVTFRSYRPYVILWTCRMAPIRAVR